MDAPTVCKWASEGKVTIVLIIDYGLGWVDSWVVIMVVPRGGVENRKRLEDGRRGRVTSESWW